MSKKNKVKQPAKPIILGDIVQIDIRKHSQMIRDIRHLLIVLHEYENDAVIVETALEMGLQTYENLLNRERDLISPF
jgi:hypothetical protein